jgi:23S rRNA (uracil1939-C5)-methyltransferase
MRLTIEKLIYGGDGLARVATEAPAAGAEERGDARRGEGAPDLPSVGRSGMKTVFVPYVLPGEVIEAEVVEERKGFARAALAEVIEPSPARVAPPCPYFGVCGGCQYQHSGYAAQLEAKRQILEETIVRGAGAALRERGLSLPPIEVHSGPEYGFRNRTRMKIVLEPEFLPQHAKNGRAGDPFALGYYRHGSHELEPVRQCPISSPLINQAIAAMWELAAEAARYPALREAQFFANHDDTQLLVELFIHHATGPVLLKDFARLLRERMPQIAGVAVFASADSRGRSGGGKFADEFADGGLEASRALSRAGAPFVEGASSLLYQVGTDSYRVSAGSFFQTNRFLAGELVGLATAGRSGRAALDLYAGVGLFTLPLARQFERITAVEIAPSSYADLSANAAGSQTRAVHSTTEDYLPAARGQWDFAIVDPPRAGLGERAAQSLARLRVPRLAYVSCDPATLARDLATLLGAGYRVEQAHLVDLFPQTYHMETVLHLAL